MGGDEKRGTKAFGHHPHPKKGRGWHEMGDRWGRGGGAHGGKGGDSPLGLTPTAGGSWPVPRSLGLLLKFQLCAQPSWLAASHVPAPGWAAGSGARGRHMDEKPGSAEQRAVCPLGPGTQSLAGPAQPCLLHSKEAADPDFHKYPGSACWGGGRGAWHRGDQGITRSGWPKAIDLDNSKSSGLLAGHRRFGERQEVQWSGAVYASLEPHFPHL